MNVNQPTRAFLYVTDDTSSPVFPITYSNYKLFIDNKQFLEMIRPTFIRNTFQLCAKRERVDYLSNTIKD